MINGAIADVTGFCEVKKGRAFVLMSNVSVILSGFCTLISFMVLHAHLKTYLVPWFLLAVMASGMMLLLHFVVPETLQPELRRELNFSLRNLSRAQVLGIQILWRDPPLRLLCLTVCLFWFSFVGFAGVTVSYLLMLGWSMEMTTVPHLLASVTTIASSAIVVQVLPRVGVWNLIMVGHALQVFAYFIFGPITLLFPLAPFAASVCTGAAMTTLMPAWNTIISQRVHEADQSKCQAAVGMFSAAGIMFGVPVYSFFLFDTTAEGFARALPALISCACSVLNLLLTCCIAALARRAPVDLSEVTHSVSSPSGSSIPRMLPRHSQHFEAGVPSGPSKQGCVLM